jgi:hypothetical protein
MALLYNLYHRGKAVDVLPPPLKTLNEEDAFESALCRHCRDDSANSRLIDAAVKPLYRNIVPLTTSSPPISAEDS